MTGPSPSLAYRLSSPAAAPLSPAAAPSPAAVSRRRLTTTPGPLRGLAPIYTESSATPPAATAEAAALPIIMYDASVGVPLRREQGKRGAHEGRAGQLYRPTPRDGAVGHTPGQAVEMILLLRRRANYRALVSLPQQRNTSHLIPPHTGPLQEPLQEPVQEPSQVTDTSPGSHFTSALQPALHGS